MARDGGERANRADDEGREPPQLSDAVDERGAEERPPRRRLLRPPGLVGKRHGRRRLRHHHVREHRGRGDAVRDGVMDLRDERDEAALQALERPHLPERPASIERMIGDLGDRAIHLASRARRLELAPMEVPTKVEIRIFDPHGVMDSARNLDDSASQRRQQMEPLRNFSLQPLEGVAAGRGGRVDHRHLERVHVQRRGLHVEEPRVEAGQSLHGSVNRGMTSGLVTFNLADLFERVADAIPDREAVVIGGRRLTYRALDERANRLAHHLTAHGIREGDAVGLQLLNGTEYLEGMLAAFKLRAVPINVNYRYVEGELRYLYADADLRVLIVHRQFLPRVASIAAKVSRLTHFVFVDDGSTGESVKLGRSTADYETALALGSPERRFTRRSGEDLYCLYTGGTTGLPKGVIWRHEDVFFAAMGGGDTLASGNPIRKPEEIVERILTPGVIALPTPPFMHASAHWLAFHQLYSGGTIVIPEGGRFDPPKIWDLVAKEKVQLLVFVGDAMARPLLDALEAKPTIETSSLVVLASGAAILSPSTKSRIAELLPDRMIIDGFGSSETGTLGNRSGSEARSFRVNEETAVLDEALRPVVPGSGTIGRLARRGHIPLRYHRDPKKSAETFVTVGGVRWALPGDLATVEEDGTVILLGRGSTCINTGGEKVFPEEVEGVLKAHPAIVDAVVAGATDETWGERVVAVVSTQTGETITLEEIQSFCRERLAGYKVPRGLAIVDEVVRSPAGKADYRWARERAAATTHPPGVRPTP